MDPNKANQHQFLITDNFSDTPHIESTRVNLIRSTICSYNPAILQHSSHTDWLFQWRYRAHHRDFPSNHPLVDEPPHGSFHSLQQKYFLLFQQDPFHLFYPAETTVDQEEGACRQNSHINNHLFFPKRPSELFWGQL